MSNTIKPFFIFFAVAGVLDSSGAMNDFQIENQQQNAGKYYISVVSSKKLCSYFLIIQFF